MDTNTSGTDVVTFLKSQHEQIKAGLDGVLNASGPERKTLFANLASLMAAHEEAEQKVVHPVSKSTVQDGNAVVAKHLKEEAEADKLLGELKALDVDSADFTAKFTKLRGAVLAHAKSEETKEFDQLAQQIDQERLVTMEKEVKRVEGIKTN